MPLRARQYIMVTNTQTEQTAAAPTISIVLENIEAMMSGDECPMLGEPLFDDEPPAKRKMTPVLITETPVCSIIAKIDKCTAEDVKSGFSKVFLQAGRLVHIGEIETMPGEPKTVQLLDISADFLIAYLSQFMIFLEEKDTKQGPKIKEVPCPKDIAKQYLAIKGWPSEVPPLMGIITAPTIRKDGSLFQTPGYDPSSFLYYSPTCAVPSIKDEPTREDAERALDVIRHLLRGFPFINDEARAVAVSAILTGLVRRPMRTAPAHVITASTPNSGKSLIADVVTMIATGREVDPVNFSYNQEEMGKRFDAMLRLGWPCLTIDNMEGQFEGESICSALTSPTLVGRTLGKSEMNTSYTNILIMITGNNAVLKGDITSRAIICTIDAGIENPGERRFDWDIRAYIREHRGELVHAALTIMRAYRIYRKNGGDAPEITNFARMEDWQTTVREPLVWLGMGDPYATAELITSNDPVKIMLAQIFVLTWDWSKGKVFSAKELIEPPKWAGGRRSSEVETKEELIKLLEASVSPKAGLNSKTMGNWLAKYRNRVTAGLRIEEAGLYQGTMQWRIADIGKRTTPE